MYKIIKPCYLDRDYKIGELLGDEVLSPKAAGRLMRMGFVVGIEDVVEAVISENKRDNECVEETVTKSQKSVENDQFEGLEGMTKEELLDIAKRLEIDVKSNASKAKIIELIQECE